MNYPVMFQMLAAVTTPEATIDWRHQYRLIATHFNKFGSLENCEKCGWWYVHTCQQHSQN